MQAVRMHQTGGPEVLALETLPDPAPAPGEVLIDVEAAGVNFIDCYHRSGLYPQPLPFTLGMEGAGTVLALGTGVTDWEAGDRVAWAGVPGSYAERIVVPADRLVPVPAELSAEQAAAALLQASRRACSPPKPVRLPPATKC